MHTRKIFTFLKYLIVISIGSYMAWNISFFQPFSAYYPPSAPFRIVSYENGNPDTVEVAAGIQYQRSTTGEFFMGRHYRFLWTTPVKAKVLNLKTEGLQLTKRGGGMQTTSFTLKDANGLTYSLRSIDKDPISVIPPVLWRTVVGSFIRDQVSATDPFALKPVLSLTKAAGIAHSKARLVFVLPDDPDFSSFNLKKGLLFYLTPKYSQPASLYNIEDQKLNLYSTEAMLRSLERNPGYSIDTLQYLRCRLFDLFIGDWDRHAGQWDWAGFSAQNDSVFIPLPKDRDQAFGNYSDGLFPFLLTRDFGVKKITSLTPDYEDNEGFSQNGSPLDNKFLERLPFRAYEQMTIDLQTRLNDDALKQAISQYPEPVHLLVAKPLQETLKARRLGLPEAARQYAEIIKARVIEGK